VHIVNLTSNVLTATMTPTRTALKEK